MSRTQIAFLCGCMITAILAFPVALIVGWNNEEGSAILGTENSRVTASHQSDPNAPLPSKLDPIELRMRTCMAFRQEREDAFKVAADITRSGDSRQVSATTALTLTLAIANECVPYGR